MRVLVVPESHEQAVSLEAALRTAGVIESERAGGGGAEAWRRLASPGIAAVVMGWNLPGISGITLLNRMRASHHHALTPVVIVSDFLHPDDFRLLEEFPCTVHISMSAPIEAYEKAIEQVLQQADWHRKNVGLLDGVFELAEGEPKQAFEMIRGALAKSPDPLPLGILAARGLRLRGAPQLAEPILRQLLTAAPGSTLAISELGKALYAQGRTGEALAQLEKAHKLAPRNLSRLCLLGDLALAEEKDEAAQSAFRHALEIDGQDPHAQAGAQVSADPKRLGTRGKDAVALALAGILNGKGIVETRAGRYAEGISAYQAAIRTLLTREPMARVAFNIGLGYLRWQKPGEAIQWFENAQEWSEGRFAKAGKYAAKLRAGGFEKVEAVGATVIAGELLELDADVPLDESIFEEESIAPATPLVKKP